MGPFRGGVQGEAQRKDGRLRNVMEREHPSVRRVRQAHEILFSLNNGVAIGLAMSFFLSWRRGTSTSPAPDFYTRTVVMADHFMANLMYGSKSTMYKNLPTGGYQIVLTAVSAVFALLVWLSVRLVPRGRARSAFLRYVGGVTALTAVPAVWLARPYWEFGAYPTWTPIASDIFALELGVIVGALYLTRAWSVATWGSILLVHYGIVGWYVCKNWWGGSFYFYGSAVSLFGPWPVLLSVVSLCSGLAWAIYVRRARKTREVAMQ